MEHQGQAARSARPRGTPCLLHVCVLVGLTGWQANRLFSEWAQLPISADEYRAKLAVLQQEIFPSTNYLPGALEVVKHLASLHPGLEIALATSSHTANFKLKTTHLPELFTLFDKEHLITGDDPRIPAGRGKPAPDIYLLALKTINDKLRAQGGKEILPAECLVFEDSVPGVESGRRAGMQVVWVPHPGLLGVYAGREKEVLAGLTGEHKEDIPPAVETAGQRVQGAPGQVDDGWGTLLKSLEQFPYSNYSIVG